MANVNIDSPEHYISRELSWLEFNDRVLREGLDGSIPLLERLKFLSIVSSNLDEFFMIRVAGLKQQAAANVRRRDISGLTPHQQLDRIAERTTRMVAEQADAIAQVTAELAKAGVHVLDPSQLTAEQRRFALSYFQAEVLPVLTPLAVEAPDALPALPGLRLMLALRLVPAGNGAADERIAVVPVPGGLPRFVALPAETGLHVARLEDLIAAHADELFPGSEVRARLVFRLTRDADVAIQEDAAGDLLEAVEKAVGARGRRSVVRLELSARPDRRLRKWVMNWTGAKARDTYEIGGMLDAAALMELAARPGAEQLAQPDWPPQPPRDLVGTDDLWQTLQEGDVLLLHPYESFEPVVRLVRQAAEDPNVLAIKQTLYRTSGDSPIIAALESAARSGKQVIVLVELKARFDEQRNVDWARRLEEAGALVIYGIAGYKTHAKALLIVRREAHRIRRYLHLSTGNYNDKTARLYSDIGLMTSDNEFTADAAAFFNLLTGVSEAVGWSKLAIAPTRLRRRFIELIEREGQAATADAPGLIIAKTNSLQDKQICQALYRASQAGVEVRLNVRGICCLRPGVKGLSENIEVTSIVDRFLEHARIFYFRNGGHEEVYLSSADWMTRNLDKRLELLFPVTAPPQRQRLIEILKTFLADNVKARRLLPDGTYQRVERTGRRVRAQERFYRDAVEAAHATGQPPERFRPLTRPDA